MKKIIVILVLMIGAIVATGTGYGQVIDSTLAPYFVSVSYYSNDFNIDTAGEASFSLIVRALNNDQLDQVTATVKIINKSTGAISYNQTLNLPYSYLHDQFRTSGSYTLTKSGLYEFQVTFKCYGDGVLLETITANPQLDSF